MAQIVCQAVAVVAVKQLRQQHIGMASTQRHVVVIGAGFAGLAAARTLLAQGAGQVQVTLLEADAVIGGAVRRAGASQINPSLDRYVLPEPICTALLTCNNASAQNHLLFVLCSAAPVLPLTHEMHTPCYKVLSFKASNPLH